MKKITSKIICAATAFSVVASCSCFSLAAGYMGDIDKDGSVNSADALEILKYSVGLTDTIDIACADMDGDKSVNSTDALIVLQTAVGTIAPVEIKSEPSASKLTTKAEIITAYNNAINKAVNEKAGYSKVRTSEITKMEGAESLMKLKVASEAVNGFLGIGETKYTNTKGNTKYLSAASLTESDVKSATAQNISGDVYKLTIELADGKSTAPTVSDTSPIIRTGLLGGNENTNTDYDYKSAANIYNGINSTGEATVKSVEQTTTKGKIVVTIDIATGKITDATISWNWTASLNEIKYSIIKVSGKGIANTSVTYNNFSW